MKHNIALIAFICSIFIIGKQNIASAQSQPSNFKYQLIYVSTGFVNMQNDSVYSRTCCVELPDSINISKIIVKAGTQEKLYDIFNYDFIFDNNTGLPSEATYFRDGLKAYLGLFNTSQTDMYHYEITLEYVDGTQTEPKYWY